MAVAKSYSGLKIVKEPYLANGRMYVRVELGNGITKTVRWYSDAEYEKYYGTKPAHNDNDPLSKTQKEMLGFKNGYITIFKGDTYPCKDWFKEHGAKYTRFWGWSFSSEMEVPAELPAGVEAMRLDWEDVGNGDDLKTDTQVQKAVDSLLYEPSNSKFIGMIGERIEAELTVTKAIALDSYYGPSTMHIMEDSKGNTFVWTTASKTWEEGSVHQIRGTIKDHKTYRNVKQNILTRCTEIKSK